jgi:hypothetical protein
LGISLDQLPDDSVTFATDGWLVHLSERLNGEHGGTCFVDGVATRTVDARQLRRFIVAFGPGVVGASRVLGEPCELGDCSAFKPASETRVAEPEPASFGEADVSLARAGAVDDGAAEARAAASDDSESSNEQKAKKGKR